MKRVLCLWLPNWPIQRLAAARSLQAAYTPRKTAAPLDQDTRPAPLHHRDAHKIVLYTQQPQRGKRVQYCSDAAWAQGIRPEMTVAEATTILRNTRNGSNHSKPSLEILEYDPDADRHALQQLATQCHQFSPLVGLEATASKSNNTQTAEPSSLLLDVTGSAPRLGGESIVAQQITNFAKQQGYEPRVGIAHTLGAAWAFAHATDDIMIVSTKDVHTELSPLPIESLRLSPTIGDLLTQLGVRQIGDLFQLPRESLQARFGPELLLRIDQATGRIAEAIIAHSPPPSLTVTRKLEHAIARRNAIEQMTRGLVEDLCKHLVRNDQEAVQLQYRLSLTSKTTNDITVGLYQATANPQHIFDLLHMQLESTHLSHPVQQATLIATIVVDRADEQHNLFDNEASPAPRQLAHLIERLSSRLGADHVVSAHLSREPQIEMAYRYRALAGKRRRPQQPLNKPISYTRPLLLIHPPVPVHTPSQTNTHPSAPPPLFYYRNQAHHTTAHWGPERIETGWWRGPTVRRDYYRVEDESGSRFWLFRDLRRRRWFLHGEFA